MNDLPAFEPLPFFWRFPCGCGSIKLEPAPDPAPLSRLRFLFLFFVYAPRAKGGGGTDEEGTDVDGLPTGTIDPKAEKASVRIAMEKLNNVPGSPQAPLSSLACCTAQACTRALLRIYEITR